MTATTAIWSAVILVGALVGLWATVTRSDHIRDNRRGVGHPGYVDQPANRATWADGQ